MRIRDDVLISSDDMGTSGTKKYDLDYSDVVSALTLSFAATNGASANVNNPIESNISKIEIVDGSDVLWSLPGDVAYALVSQLRGTPGNEYYSGAISDTPLVDIPILFGRELYDPEYGFVPRRFKNPQLQVTFNEATVRAAGATGFVSDSFLLTVIAHLMEEATEPSAWLMCKDIYDFTSAASGDENVPMPTDYPWRLLFVRNYESGVAIGTDINNYKLTCDRGKFVPFNVAPSTLLSRMGQMFPLTSKDGYSYGANGDTFQTWIGDDRGQAISSHVANIVGASSFWPGQFALRQTLHDGTATTNAFHYRVSGYCPHNLVIVPFGRVNIPAEWFNAPGFSSVNLYLTQGGAGAEVNVCVQQARSY